MSFFDQLSAKVNHGFNQVASQTKDFTDQMKIENEIKNLEKAVNACYEELGRAMYNASRNPSDTPVEYEETMRQVDGLLQQIQEKKESKQEIANKVTCPSCGKSVPAGTKFCSFCGAPMEQTPVATAVPTEPQVYDTEPQVGDDKLPMGDDKQRCPNCGEVIEPGTKFCVKCGTKIDFGEQKPTENGGSCSAETENSTETVDGSAETETEEKISD